MSKCIEGGTRVASGYYVDARTFEFVNVAADGGALPGGPGARFISVPTPVVMFVAPALGALFVVLLPLLGFVVVAAALARALASAARELAATVGGARMVAGQTGLTGSVTQADGTEDAETDPWLEELAKEIQARRARK